VVSASSADAFVTTLGSLAKGARSARYVPQAPADATFGGLAASSLASVAGKVPAVTGPGG
jgi:hypothetical protein